MVLRRLALTVPILLGTSVVVFLILRLVPGDPAASILGSNATEQSIVKVRAALGLDLPLWEQFGAWLGGVARGDFGRDYITNQEITEQLELRLPITVALAGVAFLLALIAAIPLGVVAAVREGGWVDRSVRAVAVLFIAVPDFVFGLLGILLFAVGLSLVPSSGYTPIEEGYLEHLRSLALPAAALSLGLGGVLTRVTRSAMLDVLGSDYVRFAKASGFSSSSIVFRYALRNASVPIITVIGLQVGYILGGTVVIEQLFGLPGLGQLIVEAMLARNYPVLQACILVFVAAFILVNLITDLLYTVLNPRLRRTSTS
jgi:peptide/nickel transport system permease protein